MANETTEALWLAANTLLSTSGGRKKAIAWLAGEAFLGPPAKRAAWLLRKSCKALPLMRWWTPETRGKQWMPRERADGDDDGAMAREESR